MLIHIIKSNYSAQVILLLLLTFAFWAGNFMVYQPIELAEPQTFLYSALFGWTKSNILLAKILALVCLFLQAFWLHEIARTHAVSKNSIFVALIYVVLMSAQNSWQTLQPFLISNFFIIGGYWYLFKIYDRKDPYEFVFNASFLLALASLISSSLLLFGIVIICIFLSYPINKWREWVIALVGFTFPFFVFFLWAALSENLHVFSDFLMPITDFDNIKKTVDAPLPIKVYMATILLISLAGIGVMQLRARNNEISQRKKIVAIMLGAFWLVITVLLTSYTPIHLATLFVFSAFFIAEWFFRNAQQWLSELVFYGFLAIAFGVRYL